MHPDEGYGGPKMIPGYAGAYKNEKTKVVGLKANGNPRTYGSRPRQEGRKAAQEKGVMKPTAKRRK